MELLSATYFERYDNVSKEASTRPWKDLTKNINNHIVLLEEFMFEDNDLTEKYDKFTYHTTIHEIRLTSCLVWHNIR